MSTVLPVTERTRLGRIPKRGTYDRAAMHAILDEAFICHVGFLVESRPCVIPTAYGRIGDRLYVHGSSASRMLRTLSGGTDMCLTVTLVDGVVLARSAFHHSVNYRSVVVFGSARLVGDPQEKRQALRAITNHVVPGRWEEVRPPSEQELKATSVLALELEEGSAKVRSGPPIDDEADLDIPVWAGVVPLGLQIGEGQPDAHLAPGVEAFDVKRLKRH
jgi:nitroimidazol reductase NimA-like FMN-containing flavoprotein (pyridoxamine 5'-phosphate oxidase superfamily)